MEKKMKEDLQNYLDEVIENVEYYQGASFTYGAIIYSAFKYDEKLRGYFMDWELKGYLEFIFDEYFDNYYLEGLNGNCEPLYNKLKYADTTLILDILDIAEIQEILENILGDDEDDE